MTETKEMVVKDYRKLNLSIKSAGNNPHEIEIIDKDTGLRVTNVTKITWEASLQGKRLILEFEKCDWPLEIEGVFIATGEPKEDPEAEDTHPFTYSTVEYEIAKEVKESNGI